MCALPTSKMENKEQKLAENSIDQQVPFHNTVSILIPVRGVPVNRREMSIIETEGRDEKINRGSNMHIKSREVTRKLNNPFGRR